MLLGKRGEKEREKKVKGRESEGEKK